MLDAQQYDGAVRELELIPEGLRDEQVSQMLATAIAQVREIARLKRLVQAPSGVTLDERMLSIERLLTLLPHDAQVVRWTTQARDQIVQIARRKLKDHQYRQAVDLLEYIPAPAVDTTVSGLRQHAAELAHSVVGDRAGADHYPDHVAGRPAAGETRAPGRLGEGQGAGNAAASAGRPRAYRRWPHWIGRPAHRKRASACPSTVVCYRTRWRWATRASDSPLRNIPVGFS